MAFVRWRGHCAQLLATQYIPGGSHQICLANLQGGYAASPTTREAIGRQYPDLSIDWGEVDRVLAAGPPTARPLSIPQLTWLEVEQRLQDWAAEPHVLPWERQDLEQAARILTSWRAREPGGNDP
jgi:hypothetical protein